MQKRLARAPVAALMSLALMTPVAHGFTANQTEASGFAAGTKVGTRVVRPDLAPARQAAFGGQAGQIKTDVRSGAPRVITGKRLLPETARLARPSRAGLVDAANAFLAVQDLGVDARDLALVESAVLLDKDVQFLKFKVQRDGLVIEDASVDFRFKRGSLLQVVNLSFAEAASDQRPALGGLEQRAAAAVIGSDAVFTGDAYRVESKKSGYALVRVATFDVTGASGERFRVQVEAATGKVFEVRPTTYKLDGDAKGDVYPRYYGEAAEARPYRDLNLPFTGGSVTTDANGEFAGLSDDAQPQLDGFVGSLVKIELESGTKVVSPGARVRDRWNVVYRKDATPAGEDKNMAQSMVFFHANDMIQYAKRYIAAPWLDAELTANVNLTSTCNAHWDGTTINFYSAGGGCANTGLISDVVYHEWGHGLDHNTGGIDDGAYSEGFGDIMSLIMTESNVLGIGFRTDGSPVRDLSPDKVYPRDAGEVHAEGLIIGSTFWDLYEALKAVHGRAKAKDLISNYALKTIFTATRYTDVYDALLVVDDDNGDLADGTPNYCVTNRIFTQHGLSTLDQACELASVGDVQIIDRGDGDGILEPGETAHVKLAARNAAAAPVVGLTGTMTTPAGSAIQVTDASLSWDDIPSRDVRFSRDSAGVQVAASAVCGTAVAANVALAAAGRTANVAVDFLVGKQTGTADAVAAAGLPIQIVDNETATADLAVSTGQWAADTTVFKAELKFDITHSYVGDLVVTLVAPDGTRKEITRGSGSGDSINFDEDVTALVKGLKGKGAWKLEVQDTADIDEGTLDSASLTLTPALFECD